MEFSTTTLMEGVTTVERTTGADVSPAMAAGVIRQLMEDSTVAFHTAVILGSGLQQMASDALQSGARGIPFSAVPGMPLTAVPGHHGRFVAGASGLPGVILQQGRAHYYEGWSVEEITFSVRVLAELGVERLIVTNAAGGIDPKFRPGDLMLIRDHLSLVNLNALSAGRRDQRLSPRRGREIWNARMRDVAMQLPTSLQLHDGCYAMMSGPNYETPAEVRMLQFLGADAVGMSTVPEAMVAGDHGIEVLGISCITNAAAGLSDAPVTHEDVGETAGRVESAFADWLQRVIRAVNQPDGA